MGKYIEDLIDRWKNEHKGEVLHIDLTGSNLSLHNHPPEATQTRRLLVIEDCSQFWYPDKENKTTLKNARKLIKKFLCS